MLPYVMPLLAHAQPDIREPATKLLVAWFEKLVKEGGDVRKARQLILDSVGGLGRPQLIQV
jgi:hypothetical protein